MFCRQCGRRLDNGCMYCTCCGTPVNNNQMYYNQPYYNNQMYYNQPKRTCGMAEVSMVLGLLSVFAFGFILSVPAAILGGASLYKINRENLEGKGYAITGLVTGVIVTLFWAFIIILAICMAIAEG